MKNQAGRRHPGVAWLLAFFILHSSFCLPAPGAVVRYYIMDQSGTNVLRTSVRFTSLTNPQLGQNTNYLGLRDFALANTNAPLDVTLHSGRWRVTVGPLSWVNSIPDTNGLILASSWPDLTWSNALPGALVAGSNVVVYVTNGVYVVNSTAIGGGVGLSNTPVNIWAANPKLSYGAVVDGGTDDTVALSNAVRAVSATNGSVYIPSGTTYLANSFDATNAVSWWFAPGAKVSVADGKTLNIRGDVVASPTQWLFDGYGRTYFRTNTRLARVWVDWFGADNRGAVESSTNIQRAIDAARFTRNEAYDRLGQGTFITGIKNQFGAHTPATRPLAFSPGGSFYFITNTLVSQEIWHGKYEGNQATIVGLSSNNNQSAMWAFNDCRYTIIEDLEFKAYEGAGWRFALVFSNINTVETQVTPFENYLSRLKFYGHRDGWLYCLGIGFGNDANNEAFTVDTCDFHDYARGGAVINNSQSFAIKFRDCSFSGGSRGWFGVTSWDPEFAPNGSGTYFIQGGTGGAHLIADFCATGLRPYEFTFNSEESFLAVTARFFPVHTNQFAFQADGLNFYGTNNLVAGWCLSTSTLVTTAYTNDYSSYANKWVYEWLVSTGGVHRIAVNAPSTALSELDQHIVGRPYNPSTASGTLFNVVKVGPNGVTNSFTTRGQMIPLNTSATPWRLVNYNFSSSVTAKDGAVLRSGTRRPITVESSRFNTDRPATFEVYGGSQSSVNEDGTITIEGSNFQMSDSVVPVPTMNQRLLIGRGDSSYDTNGVGGIDVRIDTANNVAASVNIFSNSVERVRQRVQHDIYGSESYLGVGGLGIFGLNGGITNAAGAGIVHSNNYTGPVIVSLFTGTPTGSKFLADDGTLKTISGGGDALTSNPLSQFAATTSAQLRGVLSDETGSGVAVFAGGDIGAATATTASANDNDTSVATTAFVQQEIADAIPSIDQVLNSGGDAAGESLSGLANLTVTTAAFLYTARSTNAIWSNPTNIWKIGLGGNIFARGRDETGVTRLDFFGNDNSTAQFSIRDDVGAGEVSAYARFLQVGRMSGSAIGTDVQAYDADLDDLADGSLTGSKVGSGISGDNITTGTVDPARLGSGSSISGKYLRGDSTWQTISGGGDALTSNPLSQFAATTSAQLRGVLSDETGTGEAMFDYGFSADGTNWFNDRVIWTNSASANSFSMIWLQNLGVLRTTNAAAANTYTDIGAGTWTNNAGGNIARSTSGNLFSQANVESASGMFLSRHTVSATAANGVGVNGGGALRWSGNGVARLSADTAANDSTLWLGQTATGWPFLTGTSNTIPQVTLGGALVVTNLNPGASVLALGVTSSGQLTTNGVTVSATPAGSNTQVQFNDGGAFGGDAGLTYNQTTDALTVNGLLTVKGVAGLGSGTNWYANPSTGLENFLAGDDAHVISAGADRSAIVGGAYNTIETNSDRSVIIGGQLNYIRGDFSVVLGGLENKITAGGYPYSTILGGQNNVINSAYSFVAGYNATAAHDGSLIWADAANATTFSSATNNTVLLKTQNGVGINTNWPKAALHVSGAVIVDGAETNSTITSGFVLADSNGKRSATQNGSTLTNLTYQFPTNSINTGVIPCGKLTFTNLTGNIVVGGFSGVDLNYNCWAKLYATNDSGPSTPRSITVGNEVKTSTNTFVLGKAFWVTNDITIMFDLCKLWTNAAAVRWTP